MRYFFRTRKIGTSSLETMPRNYNTDQELFLIEIELDIIRSESLFFSGNSSEIERSSFSRNSVTRA